MRECSHHQVQLQETRNKYWTYIESCYQYTQGQNLCGQNYTFWYLIIFLIFITTFMRQNCKYLCSGFFFFFHNYIPLTSWQGVVQLLNKFLFFQETNLTFTIAMTGCIFPYYSNWENSTFWSGLEYNTGLCTNHISN